jgi:hypothetical protein
MKITRVLPLLVLLSCGTSEPETSAQEPSAEPLEVVDVVEYYPNGAVKLRGRSRGGKRFGRWESFYPNGYRWSEMEFREGRREGDVISYYNNGMMRYQGRYYNDERAGIWSFYDTTGALIERVDMDAPDNEVDYNTDRTGLN